MIKISVSVNKVLLTYAPQLISMLIRLWPEAESNSSDRDNTERKAWNITLWSFTENVCQPLFWAVRLGNLHMLVWAFLKPWTECWKRFVCICNWLVCFWRLSSHLTSLIHSGDLGRVLGWNTFLLCNSGDQVPQGHRLSHTYGLLYPEFTLLTRNDLDVFTRMGYRLLGVLPCVSLWFLTRGTVLIPLTGFPPLHDCSLLVLIIPTSFCLLLCFILKESQLLFLPVLYLLFPGLKNDPWGWCHVHVYLSSLAWHWLNKYILIGEPPSQGVDHCKDHGQFQPQLTWVDLYNSHGMFWLLLQQEWLI